jgi:hypothetical protein
MREKLANPTVGSAPPRASEPLLTTTSDAQIRAQKQRTSFCVVEKHFQRGQNLELAQLLRFRGLGFGLCEGV